MNPLVKLLVIDDDEADRLLLKRALKTCGYPYELTEHDNIRSLPDNLGAFDCIFLDYLLPGQNGLFQLKKIREKGILTPIVIVTSQGNENIAVELMKAGASDYIVKNEINGQSMGQILRNMMRISQIIREREEAEKALRISEARLAEAQRISKIGSWEYEHGSETLHWSTEIYNLLDFTDKSFQPTPEKFINNLHAEDKDFVIKLWNDALATGRSFSFDCRIIAPSGIKHIHAQGYGLLNPQGLPEKLIGTLQDITERKLGEQEILKARESAENSMKVKEIFLANMSHEIRTPMNAILGFTRLLYETELSKEQRGFIDAIHFSGENLLVIINDILDLSKIQSGKMTIEKYEFSILELLSGIISVFRPKAQEKGLKLICKTEPNLPVMIKGDPVRLNQILTNLLANALKFTEKGSVSLEIGAITTQSQDILFEFKVKDSGIGIAADQQKGIFENFVQASNDTTRKYGGTGLGLAIVKDLVSLQEGKISVDSTPGKGSTFIVHLPFERVNETTTQLSTQIFSNSDVLVQMRSATILVVEDNAVNQLLVKKVLEKTGCTIDIASNGIEAIACLKSRKYDVVLMDVQMPEMDGYEATTYIRTKFSAPLSQIPIIAMTAHAFGSDVTQCISAGMNDYISKPFKAEDLYAKISKHLEKADQVKVISLNQSEEILKYKIDLASIYQLGNGDVTFLNELILVYDKQTPAFIEKLRGYTKSHNFEAIRSVCHQIKSSYGILKMSELDKALVDIFKELSKQKSEFEFARVSNLVNIIISLISAVNEEVKRSLRKTG
jgi:signal transduction histidine kinase/CheY-like chemotaxis protein/HPt (histidine-containing phosphotransfer) domain-containing protein